jgi:hypothetical protein
VRPPLGLRALRAIEKLDERIEAQTQKPHADAVPLTSIIGSLHEILGLLERELGVPWLPLPTPRSVAATLRGVRRCLRDHELMRQSRAFRSAMRSG